VYPPQARRVLLSHIFGVLIMITLLVVVAAVGALALGAVPSELRDTMAHGLARLPGPFPKRRAN
jgi:hypothetical protein